MQGWCDDRSSIGKKIDLVAEPGLQGVGMWPVEYGHGCPELWNEIEQRLVSACPNTSTGVSSPTNPVTLSPHLHSEVKNRTALVNPPFSTGSDTSQGIHLGAGDSGVSNDDNGGDDDDPSNDGVPGNRDCHPTRFINAHK